MLYGAITFGFILGTTAALWKDIPFTSQQHLRYIVAPGKKKNNKGRAPETLPMLKTQVILSPKRVSSCKGVNSTV